MARYLRKNEFRMDLNIKHYGRNKKPHPAYITAQSGDFYRANNITHSKYTNDGKRTYKMRGNPNRNKKNEKYRITPPYWQHKNQFSKRKIKNYKFSFFNKLKIKIINHKYKNEQKKKNSV